MRADSLQSYVRAQPFRPFRIVMNSGKFYDVRHPETIAVGQDVFIYYYRPEPGAPFDRWEFVSLALVEHVEHVPQSATPTQGDGATP